MVRISVWRSCIALLALTLSSTVAALERGRQLLITEQAVADSILSTVENALWASDGSIAEKPVYIVYSTECGWSKRLYEQSRQLGDKLQLRWIPVAARGADTVVAERSGASVAAAFAGQFGSAPDKALAKRGVDYNYAVMNSLSFQFKPYYNDNSFAFPTLIYQTADGVKVISGNPPSIDVLQQEVLTQPGKAGLQPAAVELTAEPVVVHKSPRLSAYVNLNSTSAKVFAAPDLRAPQLDLLAQGFEMPVTGIVTNSPWIEVAPWGNRGPKAYIQDELTARLALLSFQVKRSSGNLVADKPLQIRSHPDSSAPVLDTLEKGYQLTKSGVVELNGKIWDEIILYTDGTKGYVAR